jgi:hypothetical protein
MAIAESMAKRETREGVSVDRGPPLVAEAQRFAQAASVRKLDPNWTPESKETGPQRRAAAKNFNECGFGHIGNSPFRAHRWHFPAFGGTQQFPQPFETAEVSFSDGARCLHLYAGVVRLRLTPLASTSLSPIGRGAIIRVAQPPCQFSVERRQCCGRV